MMVVAMTFASLVLPVNAYELTDWKTGTDNAYGFVTKVDDNITNFKGNATTSKGAYTKAST